jgi:hypothetical protein
MTLPKPLSNILSRLNIEIRTNMDNFSTTVFFRLSLLVFFIFFQLFPLDASEVKEQISFGAIDGYFGLCKDKATVPIFLSSTDYTGVLKVSELFRKDIEMVTGTLPEISFDIAPKSREAIIIGTIGKSQIIDDLIKTKKVDVSEIKDKWETFIIEVIENPVPEVDRALVIVGSDKRGTIFGMFELSSLIGVSPWYWWADVPVSKHSDIYVAPGKYSLGQPAVKYRGIFINDEAPALSGWATEKYKGFNHNFYEKVFELILRLKSNYLWPAMWGRAFYDDDSLSPKLANDYGVVVGTSHHEPMMRAHDEWRRYGSGPWNYDTNPEKLKEFWKKGIERMGNYESLVTVGMRGDGDEPMSEENNIALLEKIVADQRTIIKEVTGKEPSQVPQVWALYKEVQGYYDKGMRVPDDVTLLLCDDNWGNIRKLPKLGEPLHAGGYGIYYHFDYVGGPRNYKWLNTNPIPKIWEQMNLAYEYGARELWIVNVGDIKPMEFPIQFFLDYAWAPDKWPVERIHEYSVLWAQQQFGKEFAVDIADILEKYAKFNSLRKPELLSPITYSLVNFHEAETIVKKYNKLAESAEKISKLLPAEYKDAYYQLILFPVLACANLNELYYTVGRNRLYDRQDRAMTNEMATKADELFKRDAELTKYYNTQLAGGKWNHMMDQTHIGYTYWQQPEKNLIPDLVEIRIPEKAAMGIAVEGSEEFWPSAKSIILPELTPYQDQSRSIDIYNRGKEKFTFEVSVDQAWLIVTADKGEVTSDNRIWVKVDWMKAPIGKNSGTITIKSSDGKRAAIQCPIFNPEVPKPSEVKGFIESNGYISIEAEHFSSVIGSESIKWQVIPDLGRTVSGIRAIPVTESVQNPGNESPHIEYKIYVFNSGEIKVNAYLSPTLDFSFKGGLNYAVSIDNEAPQIINMHSGYSENTWERWVADNINISKSILKIENPGEHILKFWLVDPGVVLQKIVIATGESIPASYLGPPESFYKN